MRYIISTLLLPKHGTLVQYNNYNKNNNNNKYIIQENL